MRVLLFHSLPGDYSVEIKEDVCPNQEKYKSITDVFFITIL